MKFGKFSIIALSAALRANAAIFILTNTLVDLVLGLLTGGGDASVAGVGGVKAGVPNAA